MKSSPSPATHDRHRSRRDFLLVALGIALAPPWGAALSAEEKTIVPADFVSVQRGDIPIILSAPHGGVESLPGVPERKGEGLEKGARGFFAGRDTNTELLADALAKALEKRVGKKPYFVVARFHRKFIDANRPPEIAVEHPRAREVYDHYRGTLAKYCDEVRERFGHGLLLDLHGQGASRTTVFRGTQDGKTDINLVKLHGAKVHAGPQSLAGLLAARGINMKPTDDSAETGGFTGGDIVRTYGKHEGIGAVQLEFGGNFRTKENIPSVADNLADGIADFLKLYLSEKPSQK